MKAAELTKGENGKPEGDGQDRAQSQIRRRRKGSQRDEGRPGADRAPSQGVEVFQGAPDNSWGGGGSGQVLTMLLAPLLSCPISQRGFCLAVRFGGFPRDCGHPVGALTAPGKAWPRGCRK